MQAIGVIQRFEQLNRAAYLFQNVALNIIIMYILLPTIASMHYSTVYYLVYRIICRSQTEQPTAASRRAALVYACWATSGRRSEVNGASCRDNMQRSSSFGEELNKERTEKGTTGFLFDGPFFFYCYPIAYLVLVLLRSPLFCSSLFDFGLPLCCHFQPCLYRRHNHHPGS